MPYSFDPATGMLVGPDGPVAGPGGVPIPPGGVPAGLPGPQLPLVDDASLLAAMTGGIPAPAAVPPPFDPALAGAAPVPSPFVVPPEAIPPAQVPPEPRPSVPGVATGDLEGAGDAAPVPAGDGPVAQEADERAVVRAEQREIRDSAAVRLSMMNQLPPPTRATQAIDRLISMRELEGEYREEAAGIEEMSKIQQQALEAGEKGVEGAPSTGLVRIAEIQEQQAKDQRAATQMATEEMKAEWASIKTRQADIDRTIDEMSKVRIDPDRYWRNAGTKNRIRQTVGAFAAGFLELRGRGRGNPVLESIERSIGRDIDAQKTDLATMGKALGAKQGAISTAMQVARGKQNTHLVAMEMGMKAALQEVDAAKAQTTSLQAKEKLNELSGQMEQRISQMREGRLENVANDWMKKEQFRSQQRGARAELALKHQRLTGLKAKQKREAEAAAVAAKKVTGVVGFEVGMSRGDVETLPKEMRERVIMDRTGTKAIGLAFKSSEAEELREKHLPAYYTGRQGFSDHLKAINDIGRGFEFGRKGRLASADEEAAKTRHRMLILDVQRAITGAQATDAEREYIMEAIPGLQTMLSGKGSPAIREFIKRFDNTLKARLRAQGITEDVTREWKAIDDSNIGELPGPPEPEEVPGTAGAEFRGKVTGPAQSNLFSLTIGQLGRTTHTPEESDQTVSIAKDLLDKAKDFAVRERFDVVEFRNAIDSIEKDLNQYPSTGNKEKYTFEMQKAGVSRDTRYELRKLVNSYKAQLPKIIKEINAARKRSR